MKVKKTTGTTVQDLRKKQELFRRRDGELRYMPKFSDPSLENIRQRVMKERKKDTKKRGGR